MDATKTVVALMATMLLVAGGAPTVVGANTADETLNVTVTQGGTAGQPVVTVTQNGSAIDGASVVADADGYAGSGTYATNANGTVRLPKPLDSITATVTVANSGQRVVRTVELGSRNDSLMVNVGHGADGTSTVTVRRNGTPVSNATVTVTADGNYSGTGNYTTDADGSVELPAPNETTQVIVRVSTGEHALTRPATIPGGDLALAAEQSDGESATVTVTRDGIPVSNATVVVDSVAGYGGIGNYTTGANGQVTLPAPNETAVVTLETGTAGNSSGETVTLHAANDGSVAFGQRVSSFVHVLLGGDRQGGIGRQVSAWVHGHHPNSRDEHGRYVGNGAALRDGSGSKNANGHAQSHGGNAQSRGGNAGNSERNGHGQHGSGAHAAGSESDAHGRSHAAQSENTSESNRTSSSSGRRGNADDTRKHGNGHKRGYGSLIRAFVRAFGIV